MNMQAAPFAQIQLDLTDRDTYVTLLNAVGAQATAESKALSQQIQSKDSGPGSSNVMMLDLATREDHSMLVTALRQYAAIQEKEGNLEDRRVADSNLSSLDNQSSVYYLMSRDARALAEKVEAASPPVMSPFTAAFPRSITHDLARPQTASPERYQSDAATDGPALER